MIKITDTHLHIGDEVGVSDWHKVTQDHINKFAELCGHDQWIHTDAERCKKESPYGSTIAQGFLILSLIDNMQDEAITPVGCHHGVNYGFNHIRFVSVVPVDSNIRARFVVNNYRSLSEHSFKNFEVEWGVTVEREGAEKPVCVMKWLTRYYRE